MKTSNIAFFAASLLAATAAMAFCQETIVGNTTGGDGKPPQELRLRDPFWPIGRSVQDVIVKPAETNVETDVSVKTDIKDEDWPQLEVEGRLRIGSDYAAKIKNVGVVVPGNIVRIKQDGIVFRFKIVDITEQGVAAKKMGYERE